MEKEKLDKIRALLEEAGVEEEVITKVEGELSEETPSEEKSETEVEISDVTPSDDVPPVEAGDEAPVDEVPPLAEEPVEAPEEPIEPAPVEEEPVEEAPVPEVPAEDNGLPEGVEEVQVGQGLPPVEEAPAEQPTPVGLEQIEELRSQLEEERAAKEGLMARIDALESALKEAGIMSESKSTTPVGVDDGTRTPDYHDDEADLDSIVDKFNKNY